MRKSTAFVVLITIVFMNLLLFQNCQPNSSMHVLTPQAQASEPEKEDQVVAHFETPSAPEPPPEKPTEKLAADEYNGKREAYISVDINSECGGGNKDRVEVRETGVFRLTKNCQALETPAQVSEGEFYFGAIAPILIVEGEIFARAEDEAAMPKPRRTSFFCTNRFHNDPKMGLEVKLLRGNGKFQGYSVQAAVHHFASTMTIQQSFTNVRPRAGRPATFSVLNKKSGAGFKLSFENAASLRGEGLNRFWFRPFAEADTLEFKDLRCWSGVIPSEI